MPELKDLSHKELAFMLLMWLWRWLDAGGLSEGRHQRTIPLEAITRSHLLVRCTPNSWQFSEDSLLTEAEKRLPESCFEGCDFRRRLSQHRNQEFLAVLLRWLEDYYTHYRERHPDHDYTYEQQVLGSVVRILGLPKGVPVHQIGELAHEISRREYIRSHRRHKKFLG